MSENDVDLGNLIGDFLKSIDDVGVAGDNVGSTEINTIGTFMYVGNWAGKIARGEHPINDYVGKKFGIDLQETKSDIRDYDIV